MENIEVEYLEPSKESLQKLAEEDVLFKINYLFENINAIECTLQVNKIDYSDIAFFLATGLELEYVSDVFKKINTPEYRNLTFYPSTSEKIDVVNKILKETKRVCTAQLLNSKSKDAKDISENAIKIIEKINKKLTKMDEYELTHKILTKRFIDKKYLKS